MVEFRMTAEKAKALFEIKDGGLYWSHIEAVYEPVRGRLAGWSNGGQNIVVKALGNFYAASDLLHLIENGEWPCYEDRMTCAAVLTARYKKKKRKQLTESVSESLKRRIDLINQIVSEKNA